ncbi:helix-turn-helix domain-containing protein [Sporolactobacillus kofuensis]|uniref:Helix-turn-helix domain-containing protein n=1 Tax=Sporolactobacillus kofuensis TaxID=269672 RepID=A0ABW1WD49_9BACL|nr:helix-turn-helix domain-containing protein [Sporolactobacillus kofuensis]
MSELGQALKEAREQKNLSLDALQEETKIQKRYLKAIEEGDFSQLPGEFYTRAFIKSYAEAVDLDFKSLSEQYASDMPSINRQPVESRTMPPDGSEADRTPKPLRRNAVRASNWSSFVNKAIVLVFVLIALMIVYILVTHFAGNRTNPSADQSNGNAVQYKGSSTSSSSNSSSENSDTSSSSSDASSTTQKMKQEKVQGSTTTYTLSGAKKFIVTVTAKTDRPAWFMASDAKTSKLIAQGTVAANGKKSYRFDATNVQTLNIQFGNVPGTVFKINGKTVKFSNTATVQHLIINYTK